MKVKEGTHHSTFPNKLQQKYITLETQQGYKHGHN